MSELFIGIIIHPAFNIVSGLIGILIGQYFTRRHSNATLHATEFNKVAEQFRNGLLEHKIYLMDLVANDIYADRVGFNITDIELAKSSFEFYLSNDVRPAFNKAWDNYKNYEKYYSDEVHNKKPSITCNDMEKCRIQLIDILLAYATPILKR